MERLGGFSTTPVALHPSASPYLPTDNKYKNINKLNIYDNTHELNDNLKPLDFLLTPHFLTFNDVLYWEFKAG